MKSEIIRYSQIVFALTITLMLVLGCKGDDSPTAQALAFEKLAGSWDISEASGSIMVDGQDVSLNFVGFSVSFNDGGYTTTNAGDLFSAVGTWEWVDQEARSLRLQDGREISIATLTENVFVFRFSFTGPVANLESGTSGNYTITVNK